MISLIRVLVPLLRKVLQRLLQWDKKLGNTGRDTERHLTRVIRSTRVHDMVTDEDEPYYARQYWSLISEHLNGLGCPRNGRYLDLGCGQGRLSIPLAKWCSSGKGSGGSVTGVDLSESAIESAVGHAKGLGLENTEFKVADIAPFVKSLSPSSVDGVLFSEVTLFLPEYKDVLEGVKKALKPGGVIFVSFRSQYFNALYTAGEHMWGAVDMLLDERSGRLWGGDVSFTWQTSGEVASLIEKELGMELVDMAAIGCCSGIKGDPHAPIVRPSTLGDKERDVLMRLEMSLARDVPDAGRYILAVAKKI